MSAATGAIVASDPVTAGAALARACPTPYVLYERDGEVLFAAGVRAELVLDGTGLRVRAGDRTLVEPLTDRPLEQVAAALAGLGVPGWRAYGWAAFELGHLLHGLPLPAGAGPLLHLLIPEHEARIGREGVRLPADPATAAAWEAALAAPSAP